MGATGTAIVDFGAFPGKSDASVTVSAPGIGTTSLVEAWVLPNTTTDHSADEHMVETLKVFADQSSIVAGTSFAVKGFNTSQLDEPAVRNSDPGSQVGGQGTRLYGKFQVGWVWD